MTSIIARGPGPLRISGVRAATLAAVRAVVGDTTRWAASDLTLGAWRPHQIASELFAQLGLPPATTPRAMIRSEGDAALPAYADVVGAGIDAEAAGDRAVLDALALAGRLLDALRTEPPWILTVLAPRFGLAWERQDELFLGFLAQGLIATPTRVVLVDPGDATVPPDWDVRWTTAEGLATGEGSGLAALAPGVVDPAVRAVVGGAPAAAALPRDHLLVPPEHRSTPDATPRVVFDRLAVAAVAVPWLAAYATYRGSSFFVDDRRLTEHAWSCFAQGGPDIAIRLMDRASECARTPVRRAACQSQAQGMRISLHRFAEVAAGPEAPRGLPEPLRGGLLQAKGWGLVMTDDATNAEAYLDEARGRLDPRTHARERLYVDNIRALGRLKCGDVAGALALEQAIEAALAETEDWRLRYVNAINLARLHRRLGDLDAAARYYARAFDTSLGVRSESDAVYANVCLARIDAERGRSETALAGWLRACLHWCAASAPEALGPRVAAALVNAPAVRLTEAVSRALADALRAAADDAGIASTPRDPLIIGRTDAASAPRACPLRACGAPGVSVLVAADPPPEIFTGREHRALRGLLAALLPDVDDATALLGDDGLGREIAGSPAELLATCLRLDVPVLRYAGHVGAPDARLRKRLWGGLRARRGPAVAGVEQAGSGGVVRFRRHRPPLALDAADYDIVCRVARAPLVAALEGAGITEHRLRALERARVLVLEADETLCERAGIRSHSSATSRPVA